MANQGRLKNLPPEKRELLNRLLRERTAPADVIQRRSAGMSRVPVSSGQRRIWFLDRMEPGLPVYQISATLPLGGGVDPEVLERSVNGLIARHESLRTTFSEIDGELFQIIAPELEIRMRMLNLIDLPVATREAEAARIGSADAAQPFDLESGPLLRVTLIRLDPDHSSLLLTLHHIISDGWSMNVLLRELSIVYEALAAGKPPPLAELPIQYPDFALWQQEHVTAERAETDLAYWRKQLAGAPRLNLPADSGGAKRTHRGGRAFFSLGAARTRQLEQISVQSGNTLFIILLAAFKRCFALFRTGRHRVELRGGRTRPETEGLIGFPLNTVRLRTDLSGDPDFLSLLERVRQAAVNAYAHQEVPFERVVESLAPDRQTAGSALFNVMFVLQVAQSGRPSDHREPAPPQPEDWQFENGTAKFDLTLSIAETASGLVGALEYSSDLFKPSTARRIIEHFTTLIDSIAAQPHLPISRLRFITTDEEQRILHEWNATAAPFPAETRVEKLVMEQAVRSPDATAIICAEGEITYHELCREANQTARNLLSRGIERGSRIGIFLERGRRLLPALLGTWAAGCAYVPLDTESPVERTESILEDANLAAVLTEEHLRDHLPATTRGLICLDREEDVIMRESGEPLPSAATASDAAYILYTSGSTGKPKGVIVAHRSLVNYLTWTNRVLAGPSPRLLPAITKITFDASLKQLFAPLLRGGAVWVVAE
jgi:hypothetical protein